MKKKWIALVLIVAVVLAGISGLSTASATDGCTDVLDLVESKGWIYHEAVDNNGHVVELPEDDSLPEGFSAIGDGVEIKVTDANRSMKAGWWTVYPTCPEPTATPITPTPEPTPEATPIPTEVPVVPNHCGAVDKLAKAMGAEYLGLTDVMHNGHLITLGEQDAFLPYGYEAVGETRTISMTDENRVMAAGTTWTIYGKCFGYLPLIANQEYVPVPTATPTGVYCLTTEALAQQLGVDETRLHMDLYDGFNAQPSGWRLDYGEEFLSWTVPIEYVVNHPEGEFTGDGNRVLDFRVGSIWLPWSCRK